MCMFCNSGLMGKGSGYEEKDIWGNNIYGQNVLYSFNNHSYSLLNDQNVENYSNSYTLSDTIESAPSVLSPLTSQDTYATNTTVFPEADNSIPFTIFSDGMDNTNLNLFTPDQLIIGGKGLTEQAEVALDSLGLDASYDQSDTEGLVLLSGHKIGEAIEINYITDSDYAVLGEATSQEFSPVELRRAMSSDEAEMYRAGLEQWEMVANITFNELSNSDADTTNDYDLNDYVLEQTLEDTVNTVDLFPNDAPSAETLRRLTAPGLVENTNPETQGQPLIVVQTIDFDDAPYGGYATFAYNQSKLTDDGSYNYDILAAQQGLPTLGAPTALDGGTLEREYTENVLAGFIFPDFDNRTPYDDLLTNRVLVHEVGHILGLSHTNNVEGGVAFGDSIAPELSSSAYSLMQTTQGADRGTNNLNGGSINDLGIIAAASPGILDIMTVQYLYGANYTYNNTNTTLNFDGLPGLQESILAPESASLYVATAIWDGGGTDTIDSTAFEGDVRIDLREGSEFYSRIGSEIIFITPAAVDQEGNALVRDTDLNGDGDTNDAGEKNFLHTGANIENARAGIGNDIIFANDLANVIDGGDGNDTVSYSSSEKGVNIKLVNGSTDGSGSAKKGYAEGDELYNIENLIGSTHNDKLIGDNNDNILEGGAGADKLYGGGGHDTVSYQNSLAGVTVDLVKRQNNEGDAAGDKFKSIESFRGSEFDDEFYSTKGDDNLDGGAGNDTINFSYSGKAVDVDLEAGTFSGHGNDTLTGFENVVGTRKSDDLKGDAGDNTFTPGFGIDKIDGRDGSDTVSFADHSLGVIAALKDGDEEHGNSSYDGYAISLGNVSLLNNIENLIGGRGNDILIGNDGDNVLEGGANGGWFWSFDKLYGGEGNDTASYKGSDHGVVADLANRHNNTGDADGDRYYSIENLEGTDFDDTLRGDENDNVLTGRAGDDHLVGNAGNDLLIAGTGTNILDGGDGDDIFDIAGSAGTYTGGDGYDIASYENETQKVVFIPDNFVFPGGNLGAENHSSRNVSDDRFEEIEAIRGTDFADVFYTSATTDFGQLKLGDLENYTIYAGEGNDEVIVVGGGSTIFTEGGDDSVSYAFSLARNYEPEDAEPETTIIDLGDGNDEAALLGFSGDTDIFGGEGIDFVTLNFSSGDNIVWLGDDDEGTVDLVNRVFDEGVIMGFTSGNNTIIDQGTGDSAAVADFSSGNNTFDMGDGTDVVTLRETSGNNTLEMGNGDDVVFALGNTGSNTINLGDGNDFVELTGFGDDLGTDFVTLGDGFDVVQNYGGSGFDVILDFDVGEDLIDFSAIGIDPYLESLVGAPLDDQDILDLLTDDNVGLDLIRDDGAGGTIIDFASANPIGLTVDIAINLVGVDETTLTGDNFSF